MPQTDSMIPQCTVEVGWCEYKESMPEDKRMVRSSVLSNNHPEWHQTILLANPPHVKEPTGFIMVILRDSHNLEDIFKTYLPVQSMGVFVPYNIRLIRPHPHNPAPTEFYLSLILEDNS